MFTIYVFTVFVFTILRFVSKMASVSFVFLFNKSRAFRMASLALPLSITTANASLICRTAAKQTSYLFHYRETVQKGWLGPGLPVLL